MGEAKAKWQSENQKRCLAEVLALIKTKTVQDPYVKNYCIVLEKQILFFNNGLASFDCSAALDGSATNSRSFVSHFHHSKVGKTKWRKKNCLLEVISHNYTAATGGISLPLLLIIVCS